MSFKRENNLKNDNNKNSKKNYLCRKYCFVTTESYVKKYFL